MDDEIDTNVAQWWKLARQRGRKAIRYAVGRQRRAKQLFCQTEDRLEHTAEAYQRALLCGADLRAMSAIEVIEDSARLEPEADRRV